MRTPALLLTILAAVLLIATASAEDAANPKPEDAAKKIKELQQERIATLKELVDSATRLFKNASASAEEAYEARLLLLKAELDAAENEADRIALYKNVVDVLKEYEQRAHALKSNAQATHSFMLRVKARRLEAEIDLERAEAAVPPKRQFGTLYPRVDRSDPKDAPWLAGKTVPGRIGKNDVTFTFGKDGKINISGSMIGEGTWSPMGLAVFIETAKSSFVGQKNGDKVSGRLTVKVGDGVPDEWEVDLSKKPKPAP